MIIRSEETPKIMKKILTALLLIAGLTISVPYASAQNKSLQEKQPKEARHAATPKTSKQSKKNDGRKDKQEASSGKTKYKMASETDGRTSGYNFVIDGHVALDIPDSCYRIYIADIDKEITESDYVVTVPVKNKQFRFETNMKEMKAGRLRAVMPGGNLCSAWINIYFIPGFTIDMTVHNGYFDISNESEYTFMSNAWLNKEAMAAMFERLGAPSFQNKDIPANLDDLQGALLSYQYMLDQLKKQFQELLPRVGYTKETQQIVNRMDQINAKMENMVDQYAKSIKF